MLDVTKLKEGDLCWDSSSDPPSLVRIDRVDRYRGRIRCTQLSTNYEWVLSFHFISECFELKKEPNPIWTKLNDDV